MEKVLAIAEGEISNITKNSDSVILKAEYLMQDLILRGHSAASSVFINLCELVTTARLLKATLEFVTTSENLVKGKYYKVDPLTYEAIKSSLALQTWLKEEMAYFGCSLEDH